MSVYLIRSNINYNNEAPFYKIEPLYKSDQKEVIVFAGKGNKIFHIYPVINIYISTRNPINADNMYKNLHRLFNIFSLESGLASYPTIQSIDDLSFEQVYDSPKKKDYHKPGVRYAGFGEDNIVLRTQLLIHKLNKLKCKQAAKIENILHTLFLTQEIEQSVNPQSKYSLFMTLYISMIEQLADNSTLSCGGTSHCDKCKQSFKHLYIKGKGILVREMIDKYITGNSNSEHKKLLKKLYKKRSSYLHGGKLIGNEMEGGFLKNIGNNDPKEKAKQTELLEDYANIKLLLRKLIEQTIIKGS